MGTKLQELSDELAGLCVTAAPTVVRIEGRRRGAATGLVWAADGKIVSASHAVERDDGLTVGLADGRSVTARVLGRDPTTDLVLLQAEATGLEAAAFAAPGEAKVGQVVLALLRPGRTLRARLGIVAAVGDAWRSSGGGKIDRYLEADVAVQPGLSGGPLVAAGGKVLGLVTAGLTRGAVVAIPPETLARVVGQLASHGRVPRGYLGIGTHPVALPPAIASATGEETGLLVTAVEAGSPAQQAGLLFGDTIIGHSGGARQDARDLLELTLPDRIGTTVTLRLIRSGAPLDVELVVGQRP